MTTSTKIFKRISISLTGILFIFSMALIPSHAFADLSISQFSGANNPINITTGSNGNLWFTDSVIGSPSSIGRITPDGTITEFSISDDSNGLEGITKGPDNNIWFTEPGADRIGRITPAGSITEFSLPGGTGADDPRGITTGSDGNLWFTEFNGHKIGQITTAGVFTEFALASNAQPHSITSGPDGNLWFTDWGTNSVGQITPSGAVTTYPIATSSADAQSIITGPDGNLWFTEFTGNKIGRVTTSGTTTEFLLPSSTCYSCTRGSGPFGITSGSDGNLWFTELRVNTIGQITPSGNITEFTGGSNPAGITTGPDANLWFAERGAIGRINLPGFTIGSITAPTSPVQTNTLVNASAPFTDSRPTATHTASWDWGDGSTSTGVVTEVNGSGSVSGNHTYVAPGVYTVTLTVIDNFGVSHTSTYQYVSVYNPTSQGLFSAGSHFTSPAGAYIQNPSLTGKVKFGLRYKYKGTMPVGNKQFTMAFNAANLTFNATTVSSLVIANGMATMTGTGTINGAGNYNFLVTGVDGGGIRVQITDPSNNNNVIYDTQPGAAITDTPTIAVTGRVVVHS